MFIKPNLRVVLLAGTALLTVAAGFSAQAQTQVAAATQVASNDQIESVIVTGTRVAGLTAANSAAPISVIGSDALAQVGQANLIQALAQISPMTILFV